MLKYLATLLILRTHEVCLPEDADQRHDHLALHLHDVLGGQEHAGPDLAGTRDEVLGIQHVVFGALTPMVTVVVVVVVLIKVV